MAGVSACPCTVKEGALPGEVGGSFPPARLHITGNGRLCCYQTMDTVRFSFPGEVRWAHT